MKTLKVLSALLSYPTEELLAARDELIGVLEREAVLPRAERRALALLIDDIAAGDALDHLGVEVVRHADVDARLVDAALTDDEDVARHFAAHRIEE